MFNLIEFSTKFEYVEELQERKGSDFCHLSRYKFGEEFGIVGLDSKLVAELRDASFNSLARWPRP